MKQLDIRVRSRIDNRTVHPGRILFHQWMHPLDISQNELGRMMGVSARRVNEIVNGRRAITADSAVRLAKALGMDAHYWLALQADYEISRVRTYKANAEQHPRRIPPLSPEERKEKRTKSIVMAWLDPQLRDMVEPPEPREDPEL